MHRKSECAGHEDQETQEECPVIPGLRNFLALEEQVELTLQLKSIAVPIRVLRSGGLTVETTGLKEPLPGRELSWVDQGFHGGEVFQQS